MKRFRSSLTRYLRLRQQKERMAELHVARARSEVDIADARLLAAQASVNQRAADLEARLLRPGNLSVVLQAKLEFDETELNVQRLHNDRSAAAEQLRESVDAYRIAQQERELIERGVERHRQEHRRSNARAAAVELQDWSLRPTPSSIAADWERT